MRHISSKTLLFAACLVTSEEAQAGAIDVRGDSSKHGLALPERNRFEIALPEQPPLTRQPAHLNEENRFEIVLPEQPPLTHQPAQIRPTPNIFFSLDQPKIGQISRISPRSWYDFDELIPELKTPYGLWYLWGYAPWTPTFSPLAARLFSYYNERNYRNFGELTCDELIAIRPIEDPIFRDKHGLHDLWGYAPWAKKPNQPKQLEDPWYNPWVTSNKLTPQEPPALNYQDAKSDLESIPRTKIDNKDSTAGQLIRAALDSKNTVIVNIRMYESFMSQAVTQSGIVPMPNTSTEELHGRHALLVVGYKSIDGQDYYIIKNSWGAAWGDKGYCYIPAKFIESPTLTSEIWTLDSVGKTENPSPRPVAANVTWWSWFRSWI